MTTPLYRQIKEQFQLGPASHMTHLDNLRGILTGGGLKSYNSMRGNSYHNLANEDVQSGRAGITVAVSGRPLHDYVPLYFGWKTPMVAWNQAHNNELVFLRFSLNILGRANTVITDGNARAGATQFRAFTGTNDLEIVDPRAINTVKYAHDNEFKRRKQAEILILDSLPFSEVLDIICFSESSKNLIVKLLEEFGIKKTVKVNTGWYFTRE